MACSNRSLSHVVKFDVSNLPLWKLGLDVAQEEHDVQSVTDGTCRVGNRYFEKLFSITIPIPTIFSIFNYWPIMQKKKYRYRDER
jgi:hypothetical protein